MLKLSQIRQQIEDYIDANGDAEVISVGTMNGEPDVEFVMHLAGGGRFEVQSQS